MNLRKPQVLLLSIKPEFVQKILDKQKTIELRKAKPQLSIGDFILVYESSPTKSLVGWFEVQEIIYEETQVLWKKVKDDAGVSKKEFDDYYQKSNFGVGIRIKDRFTSKLSLEEIRKTWVRFRPPQSFHYLKEDEIAIAEKITGFNLVKTEPNAEPLRQLALNY
jgi:predicted transcriptional regulator